MSGWLLERGDGCKRMSGWVLVEDRDGGDRAILLLLLLLQGLAGAQRCILTVILDGDGILVGYLDEVWLR